MRLFHFIINLWDHVLILYKISWFFLEKNNWFDAPAFNLLKLIMIVATTQKCNNSIHSNDDNSHVNVIILKVRLIDDELRKDMPG